MIPTPRTKNEKRNSFTIEATRPTRFFAMMSASITYGNFKSAIASHPAQNHKRDSKFQREIVNCTVPF
jgi:hypothetical protein